MRTQSSESLPSPIQEGIWEGDPESETRPGWGAVGLGPVGWLQSRTHAYQLPARTYARTCTYTHTFLTAFLFWHPQCHIEGATTGACELESTLSLSLSLTTPARLSPQ